MSKCVVATAPANSDPTPDTSWNNDDVIPADTETSTNLGADLSYDASVLGMLSYIVSSRPSWKAFL